MLSPRRPTSPRKWSTPVSQCNVDGRQLWRWATALNLVDVRILETVHAPSGLGLVPSVCLLPAQNKARGDHPFTVFFSDHVRLRGIYDCHSLEIEYSLPFGFDCFRKLRLLFVRQVVPGYLVGVPSTDVKLSMQRACLGRRDRKCSVFLAFTNVKASSLRPCLLDVHRSFYFGRHPSSLSVTFHRHSVVSRRSFLGHAHVESLSSWIIACSGCNHLLELGRACFRGMERNNRFTGLGSSWHFPTRFHHRLPVRGCVQMVSRGISLFSKSNSATTGYNLHVGAG